MMMTPDQPKARTLAIEREVRFAVVIYGGVSLAVYINGVVQELLSMVRSTSDRIHCRDLKGSEKVYYELASLVSGSEVVPSAERPNEPGKVGLTKAAVHGETGGRPKTRFVVDILCGTSAGGINAIYLAKALTNGTMLTDLARMWIVEADMTKLLNDKCVKPKYLQQKDPPSLLNSSWMYLKLLEALQNMNAANPEPPLGSMVEDLDLYCTTTDLAGIPITLPLTDKGVKEHRYKSEYWFKRRGSMDVADHDDFKQFMDPFLAFVARCTSSFPVAFEPMTLEDIVQPLKHEARFKDYFLKGSDEPKDGSAQVFGADTDAGQLAGASDFQQTCRIYDNKAAREQVPFNRRAFGDGGYLHNKPFNYAIETLKKRSANLPVDRKLIYIEPEPEILLRTETTVPLDAGGIPIRPNVMQNAIDAAITLPQYQTIQDDINCVIEWNSDIARLQQTINSFNGEIERAATTWDADSGENSISYRTYIKLRRSAAADQLAGHIADAMSLPLDSSAGDAIRAVVTLWRNRTYGDPGKPHPDPGKVIHQDLFLYTFDLDFCQRALRYLRTNLQKPLEQVDERALLEKLKIQQRNFQELANTDPKIDLTTVTPLAYDSWTAYLKFMANPAAAALVINGSEPGVGLLLSATDAGREARVRWVFDHPDHPIGVILDPNIAADALKRLSIPLPSGNFLDGSIAGASARRSWCATNPPGLKEFVAPVSFDSIKNFVVQQFTQAYTSPDGTSYLDSIVRSLKDELFSKLDKAGRSAWTEFEVQDSLVFPIIFGTPIGEFETVDIFRISPRDTTPIAGTSPSGVTTTNPPLKGSSVDAFGGFLDQSWRLSDMLRGRLDGAERLITAVLPDSDPDTLRMREQLIKKAQEAIALDWKDFQDSPNLPQSPASSATLSGKIKAAAKRWTGKSQDQVKLTTIKETRAS